MHTNQHLRRRRRAGRALLVAGCLLATAAGAAPAGASVPATAPGTAAVAGPTTVVLPTGERVGVRWSGGTPLVSQVAGDRTPITVVRSGGRVYAIPPEAMPYLGAALDLSLFDVAALATAEAQGARIPVTVATTAPVPGVTATGPSTGYLDGAPFGAAARVAVARDPGAARAAGTPVPGLTRLALTGAPATAVHPDFPMETLTVSLVPPAGQTVTGAEVLITDMDDNRAYSHLTRFGPQDLEKVSVPQGHYSLVGLVDTGVKGDEYVTAYVPIAVDYAVTGTGQSITLDANQATTTASYATPRPSDVSLVGMDIVATDGTHPNPPGFIFNYFSEDRVRVQPTAQPRNGALEFDTFEHRLITGDSGTDYYLTAEWPHGIPADLSRRVRTGQLARVDDRVYADGATGDVSYGRAVTYPDDRGELDFGPGLPATTHTDLVYGPPDATWWATVGRDSDQTGTGGEYVSSHPVSYRVGRTYREDWFRPSTGPGFPATTPFPVLYCPDCRTDNGMALIPSTATDADPDHSGFASGSVTGWLHLRVQQDGVSIVDATDTPALTFPVPPERHSYRIEVTADRAALGFTAGTETSAVYTVDSAAGDGTPIPDGWQCPVAGTGACTALPLLTITAALPVSRNGTAPTGRSTFLVRVGHVPGATTSAITALTADTAVGAGAYQPARVTDLGGGRYAVTVTTPTGAGGQPVSVRFHAGDAAGGTLTQTVTDAYTLATT